MSNLKQLVAALGVSLLFGAMATAAPASKVEAVIKKVQEHQNKVQTLQADFRQEKEMALLAKAEVSNGTFTFSRPNNVFWNYNAPRRVQMVIAGGFLTTYYPELEKAERLDIKKFEDRIFKYMGASGAIDELARYFDFTFSDAPSRPVYILDLTPKNKAVGKRVQRIKLWIDKKTYMTTKIEYVEGDGDITRYEFTNLRVNEPVPSSRFALNLPANVRVEQMKVQ